MHTRVNIGYWTIGTQWILKDGPNYGNDLMTWQFLNSQPEENKRNIPLLEKMISLSAPEDKIHFTIMSKAQGTTLQAVWEGLSKEEKAGYVDQMVAFLRDLRKFTSPIACKVDGTLLYDLMISDCDIRRQPVCKKIGKNNEEWFANMEEELYCGIAERLKTKDLTRIEATYQRIKGNFPKSEPYFLTHGDLNLTNIMVKDEKIQAIIDWEMAGYYPWWVERYECMQVGYSELMGPVRRALCPEMDLETFRKTAAWPASTVKSIYNECKVEHSDQYKSWLRPAFCDCKLYDVNIDWEHLGNQPTHTIKSDFDWAAEKEMAKVKAAEEGVAEVAKLRVNSGSG